MKVKSLSRVRLFVTPWTVAYQDPQSMVLSRQEYWSGLPFPSPGDLPDPGIETGPGWMHETSAQGWCTGKTQRDRVVREAGGGDRDWEYM